MKQKRGDCTIIELIDFCHERPAYECYDRCPLNKICGVGIRDFAMYKKEMETEIEV